MDGHAPDQPGWQKCLNPLQLLERKYLCSAEPGYKLKLSAFGAQIDLLQPFLQMSDSPALQALQMQTPFTLACGMKHKGWVYCQQACSHIISVTLSELHGQYTAEK